MMVRVLVAASTRMYENGVVPAGSTTTWAVSTPPAAPGPPWACWGEGQP